MNNVMYEYEINYLFNLLVAYNDLHNLNIINKDMYSLFCDFVIKNSYRYIFCLRKYKWIRIQRIQYF